MKALDTNVLVRFLTNDDQVQAQKVLSLFRTAQKNGERFYVCKLVQIELIWVLDSVYKYRREEILSAFERMLALPVLLLESPEILEEFMVSSESSRVGLSDLLIGLTSKAGRCESTLTFDRKAAKEARLFKLVG